MTSGCQATTDHATRPITTIVGRPRRSQQLASPDVLGDEIRKARTAAGLTQEELAFRARLSRNYISLMELGTKSPTVETLLKLCEALEVKASALIASVEA